MAQERQPMANTSQSAGDERRRNPRQDSLPGAAKRRLKKLLAQGVEYARARELCKQPIGSITQGTKSDPSRTAEPNREAGSKRGHKRNRSEEVSPKENPKKTTKLETARPTFKEVVSAIKIGIKAEDRHMSPLEMTKVQSSILRRMDNEAAEGGGGPHFIACSHRDGWLCFTCGNEHDQKWLSERVNSFKPWEGAKLAIMLEKDFPRPYIGVVWVPGPLEDPRLVLQRIKYQNDHLDCARWRLLNSTPGEKGQHITFSMAQSSYAELQKQGFSIWLSFSLITVRIKTPKTHVSGVIPMDLTEQVEPTDCSTAPPERRQQDIAPAAEPVATSSTAPFRGGNADVFDPQQPGTSGTTQALTRAPTAASSSGGMALVPTRDPTAVSQIQGGHKGSSGATSGPAYSKPTTVGRVGFGRTLSAHQQTKPSKPQRGAMRRGAGRGASKVPGATKPTQKALSFKKP